MAKPPKYCGPHHPSGKGYAWRKGKQIYFPGDFGSPESVMAYRRFLSEIAGEKPLPDKSEYTVAELFEAWFKEHEATCPNKKYSHYLQCCKSVISRCYASTLAADFGPRKLRDVRDGMVESGWAMSTINQRVGRIKKVFKWGVSSELVPPDVMHSLYSLSGIVAGGHQRSIAKSNQANRLEQGRRDTPPSQRHCLSNASGSLVHGNATRQSLLSNYEPSHQKR